TPSSRASSSCGDSSVSSSAAAFRYGGCSAYPHGSVSRIVERRVASIRRAASRIAASRSPRLAPSPTNARAITRSAPTLDGHRGELDGQAGGLDLRLPHTNLGALDREALH